MSRFYALIPETITDKDEILDFLNQTIGKPVDIRLETDFYRVRLSGMLKFDQTTIDNCKYGIMPTWCEYFWIDLKAIKEINVSRLDGVPLIVIE